MNKLILTLIATVAAAGAAQAQEATVVPTMTHASSQVSRADVHAQAVAALKADAIEFGEVSMRADVPSTSNVSRAEVRAEALEASRLGVLIGGEVTVLPTAAEIAAIEAAGQRVSAQVVAAN